MKYVYLILLSFIIEFEITKCSVTERLNNEDVDTTQTTLEKEISKDLFKETSEKKFNKKVQIEESSVYLDDVLFTLNNLQWSAEERPCLDDIYRLLYGLQNFTLWAVWDWDAMASEPQGLLFGNRYQLGNFDQCMNAPWSETYAELRTKYCLAEIVLERTDKAVRRRAEKPFNPYKSALDFIQYRPQHFRPLNELTWGVCVPLSCPPRTVERLLGVMLARSHLGAAGMRANITIDEKCQSNEQQRPYDAQFYAFFIVMGALALMCLICTFLNNRNTNKENLNARSNSIIRAFCIKENAVDLLKMKKEGIEVLYGIRYVTMCLIVLDHQMGIYNSGPISDGLTLDQVTKSPLGLLVLHDDLFVDTFFLLSGFLTITNFMKFKRLPNPLLLILKRYVRLIVALAIVVFYICAVYPYTGSGPLWNRAISQDTVQCRKNWWLNMLMVQNYIDTENICMVISWYIPSDFHFFVVTVLVFWLYKQCPRLGVGTAAVLTVLAIVLPGVINYMYKLSAVQLFTFDFITNPRGREDYHVAYIKSHTRYAAYLVGCYSGYAFLKISADNKIKIKQKWSILGTSFAVILMFVVMVYGGTFLWRSYNPIESAIYAALNRPVWAGGVALLVFCCSFGHVPLVKSFLSWYPWVPLSRLSYGLYVTHGLIITRNVFTTRNPQHNDYFEILNSAAGVVLWGSFFGLLIWLLAEGPINKLLSLLLNPTGTNKTKTNDESSPVKSTIATNENTMPSTSSGYINDNLPSNILFSSKV